MSLFSFCQNAENAGFSKKTCIFLPVVIEYIRSFFIKESIMNYLNCSAEELEREYQSLKNKYDEEKAKGLNLNMARGKPGKEQLDLSNGILDVFTSESNFIGDDGVDIRNYGILDGIYECRKMFGQVWA